MDSTPPMHCYRAFGLLIASRMPLPELAPLADVLGGEPDVTIQIEPASAEVESSGRPLLSVDAGGATLVVADVGRFRVEQGRRITVTPHTGAGVRNVRLYLLGSAFGILCHQRGLLPLHANAIVVGGQAMAFCGRSGVGKSTLAAYFASRGHPVLCDDVCVVSFDQGRPLAWPGLPRLKLWRDAAEAFGHDSSALELAIDGMEKYHVPTATVASAGPFPLARVYLLSELEDGAPADITAIKGARAVQTLLAQTYRKVYLRPMGLMSANVLQATSLAKHAEIFSAPRRRGFDVFEAEAARLEHHLSQAPALVQQSIASPEPS